jgi:hypothetical protein
MDLNFSANNLKAHTCWLLSFIVGQFVDTLRQIPPICIARFTEKLLFYPFGLLVKAEILTALSACYSREIGRMKRCQLIVVTM